MQYYIIPQPYALKPTEGVFRFRYNTTIVLNENCAEQDYYYAKLLAGTIKACIGYDVAIRKGEACGENEIYFDRRFVTLQELPEREFKLRRDSYKLSISEKQIVISAGYANGMLYGVQTLRQLISQLSMTLPCLVIEDKPAIPNRGFYHDATRGRIQLLDEYKRLAERCAYYKLNQLQLYVEHSYLFREFSEVWRDDTPLTAEDILELDRYCRGLGIELVPSIATFGHLDKVLKTKSFAELCELENSDQDRFSFRGRMEHHTINMTDPGAWDFIRRMLDEFIPLFSSRQFNLCGDETFDLGKGKSKQLAEEVGTHRIYVDFVKKICEYLVSKGLRPMFWGDIIVGSPELLKELPAETICLTWGYSEEESDRSAKTMDSVGATQYLCPGVHGWRHLINKSSSAYANISKMCSYAHQYNALGVLNTDWGDYGHVAHPAFSIPGMIYGAEGSWNAVIPPESEENKRISAVEYGDSTGEIVEIISALGNQEAASWNSIVNCYEFFRDKDIATFGEYKEFWNNLWIAEVEQKNSNIRELVDRLTDATARIQCDKSIIYSYLLHAKGQELLNLVAGYVGEKCFGIDLISAEVTDSALQALAGRLEEWFMAYKNNWRVSSRESELYRVQEVIFWYADLLRDISK